MPPLTNVKLEQLITWTLIPKGVSPDGDKLIVSLVVSPRLKATKLDGSIYTDPVFLDAFPIWLDWPGYVKENFETIPVNFAPNVTLTANRLLDDGGNYPLDGKPPDGKDPLDSALWKAIFNSQTKAKPYEFVKLDRVEVFSARPKHLGTEIRSAYDDLHKLVRTQQELPGLDDLMNLIVNPEQFTQDLTSPFKRLLGSAVSTAKLLETATLNRRGVIDLNLNKAVTERGFVDTLNFKGLGFDSKLESSLFLLNRFHENLKPAKAGQQQPRGAAPAAQTRRALMPADTELTFHELVALAGDYPWLLRKLGLVIDYQIALTAQVPAESALSLALDRAALEQKDKAREQRTPPATPVLRIHRTPKTACVLIRSGNKAAQFQARSADGSSLKNGLLDLSKLSDLTDNNPHFDLQLADYEGLALQILNLGFSLWGLAAARNQPRLTGNTTQQHGITRQVRLPGMRSTGIAIVHDKRAEKLKKANEANARKEDDFRASREITFMADDLVRGYRVDVSFRRPGTPWSGWYSLCQRLGTYTFKGINVPLKRTDEGYVKAAAAAWGTNEKGEEALLVSDTVFRWDGWSLCVPRLGKMLDETAKGSQLIDAKMLRFSQRLSSTEQVSSLDTEFAPVKGSLPRLRFGWDYRVRVRVVDLAGNSRAPGMADDTQATEAITYSRLDAVPPPAVLQRAKDTPGESLERMVIRSNHNRSAQDYFTQVLQPLNKPPIGRPEFIYTGAVNERHLAPPKTSLSLVEAHGMLDQKPPAESYEIACRDQHNLPGQGELANFQPAEKWTGNYLPDLLARAVALVGVPGAQPGRLETANDRLVPVINDFSRIQGRQDLALNIPFSFEQAWPNAVPFRIRLEERSSNQFVSAPPVWDRANRVLTVYLAKAEVRTIRYSSALSWSPIGQVDKSEIEALDQLGFWNRGRRQQADATTFQARALAGLNPLLTPYRELVLVHAVQQPLTEPKLAINVYQRPASATHIDLTATANLHVKSTGRLEVVARWQEPVDDPKESKPKTIAGSEVVRAYDVAENTPEQWTLTPGVRPTDPIRQSFGDTKYREVKYAARATTRFREYFPTSLAQDINNLSRSSAETTVQVLSTARPAAPKVLYVVPTFDWKRNWERPPGSTPNPLHSTREGNGLRVYLDRPWYSSGDGELLGVVLFQNWTTGFAPLPSAPPFDVLKPYVTQWGKDPIYASQNPALVFQSAKRIESDLTVSEAAFKVNQTEVKARFQVVGYEVKYDEARKLWYSDIEFDAGNSYFPFVRLALARYQPNSVSSDLKLSPIVLTDFAQPAPDRSVSVSYNPQQLITGQPGLKVTVNVKGTVPSATGASKMSTTIRTPDGGSSSGLNYWTATLEVRSDDVHDFGWRAVGQFDRLVPASGLTAAFEVLFWNLPQKRRVVVKEYEAFATGQPAPNNWDWRVVYAEHIELP